MAIIIIENEAQREKKKTTKINIASRSYGKISSSQKCLIDFHKGRRGKKYEVTVAENYQYLVNIETCKTIDPGSVMNSTGETKSHQ